MEDAVSKDVVRISVGPVLSCSDFREKVMAEVDANDVALNREDKKQAVADAIMAELEKMHTTGEKRREQFLK
jgi:glycerol-3-phosphate O-acyltransferase